MKYQDSLYLILLKDLLDEKIIVDNKINRRDHRYFINNNNILYNTKKEIEKFKLDLLSSISTI